MQGFDSSSPAPEQVRADSTGICKESHLVPLPGFLSFPGFLFFRGGGGTGRFRLRPAKPMGVSPRGFDSRSLMSVVGSHTEQTPPPGIEPGELDST